MQLSVIIPIKDEQDNLAPLHDRLTRALVPLVALVELFFFAAAFFGTDVFVANFFAVLVFCAGFFVGFAFRRTAFFDLVGFFLVFFFIAIRAV